MRVIDAEGKSVDDATRKALKELGITDPESVKIEVLDEGKSGIFGFGVSKPAKVRVYYNSDAGDIADIVKEMLLKVMGLMDIDCSIRDIKESESKVYIELESKTGSGLIIGKKGKTLESIQFMLNLMVNQKTGSDKKVILDIESYRSKREKTLRKMSRDIAQKVIRTGRPWTLEPMNPFERRLVHLSLQNDTRVATKSEGQGIYRKVTIMPK